MSNWQQTTDDYLAGLAQRPAARQPATLGEIWNTEWKASGLDTLFGSGKPMMDAYEELHDRLTGITGKDLGTLARERNLDFMAGGFDGRVQTMGRIIDTLPDAQQKLLADYKDVRGRARSKAADIERESADVAGATYGVSGHATALFAGIARQMVDPLNVAAAPIGPTRLAAGASGKAIAFFLAKEAAAGGAVQAVQEPAIARNREELGLESSSFENIVQAGLGQAALSGLFMAAGAALRRLRAEGKPVPEALADVSPDDLDALSRQAARDAEMERLAGDPVKGAEAIEAARAALEAGRPIEGISAARAAQFDLSAPRPIRISDDLTITVKYELMDLADLRISHSIDGRENAAYPQALQPRDRSEAASLQWVKQEAARLDPEQLGPASTAQQGAPIVARDGVVESGNGRALLLAEAYENLPEQAAAYRAYLDELGFDTRNIERPVLVRVRETELAPEQRIAMTRDANVTATASLAPAARAKVDAGKIDDALMAMWGGTQNVDTVANAAFNRAFAARAVARTELPEFMRADGTLTEGGAKRIRAALVARAWREDDLIAKAADDASGTSKMIVEALIDTAPLASRLRAAVEEGRIPREMDVGADIVAAFRLVEQARRSGQKVAALVDQIDLERGATPASVRDAVAMFFRDADFTIAASADVVADRIRFAIDHALMRQQDDLFGDAMDKAGLMRAARFTDEPLDQTPLSALDKAKARTEAAEKQPEPQTPANVLDFNAAKLQQPFTNLDELFALAPVAQQELIDALRGVGRGDVKDPGIKARDGDRGVEAKVKRKGYDDIREVTDVARGGILIERPSDAALIVASLRGKFQIWDEGWKTNEVGYVDRKVMVRTSNGLFAEVQILENSYASAKKAGHKLYERREAARLAGDIDDAKQIKADEIRFWADVQAALPDDWRAALGFGPNVSSAAPNASLANASLITRPSSPISPELTDSQPRLGDNTNPSSEPSSTAASRPSQLNSLNSASAMEPSSARVAQGDAESNAAVKGVVNEKRSAPLPPEFQSLERQMQATLGELSPEAKLFDIGRTDAEGEMIMGSASELLAEQRARVQTAAELQDCVTRTGGA